MVNLGCLVINLVKNISFVGFILDQNGVLLCFYRVTKKSKKKKKKKKKKKVSS
jgi:hypothetical protein